MRSIPPSPRAWEWDFRSAVRSSTRTEGGCGLLPMTAPALHSTSPCRENRKSEVQKAPDSKPVIAIVDDDASVREGLHSLIRSAGWRAQVFASAQEFLDRRGPEAPSCVVLDLEMPGPSGLELQKRMAEAELEIPIVFLTGHGNIPASVQAMKAGAVEFLTKPVEEQDLLRAIGEALERDRTTRQEHAEM